MKQLILEKEGILLQEVPEKSERYCMIHNGTRFSYSLDDRLHKVDVPPNMKIVGESPGLTEDQAKEIVKYIDKGSHVYSGYLNYTNENRIFNTALRSFESLLKREGIYMVNPYEKITAITNQHEHLKLRKWVNAEQNRWQKIVILKKI